MQLIQGEAVIEFNIPIAEQDQFFRYWTSRESDPSYPKQSLIGMIYDFGTGKITALVEEFHGGKDKFISDLTRVENDYKSRA